MWSDGAAESPAGEAAPVVPPPRRPGGLMARLRAGRAGEPPTAGAQSRGERLKRLLLDAAGGPTPAADGGGQPPAKAAKGEGDGAGALSAKVEPELAGAQTTAKSEAVTDKAPDKGAAPAVDVAKAADSDAKANDANEAKDAEKKMRERRSIIKGYRDIEGLTLQEAKRKYYTQHVQNDTEKAKKKPSEAERIPEHQVPWCPSPQFNYIGCKSTLTLEDHKRIVAMMLNYQKSGKFRFAGQATEYANATKKLSEERKQFHAMTTKIVLGAKGVDRRAKVNKYSRQYYQNRLRHKVTSIGDVVADGRVYSRDRATEIDTAVGGGGEAMQNADTLVLNDVLLETNEAGRLCLPNMRLRCLLPRDNYVHERYPPSSSHMCGVERDPIAAALCDKYSPSVLISSGTLRALVTASRDRGAIDIPLRVEKRLERGRFVARATVCKPLPARQSTCAHKQHGYGKYAARALLLRGRRRPQSEAAKRRAVEGRQQVVCDQDDPFADGVGGDDVETFGVDGSGADPFGKFDDEDAKQSTSNISSTVEETKSKGRDDIAVKDEPPAPTSETNHGDSSDSDDVPLSTFLLSSGKTKKAQKLQHKGAPAVVKSPKKVIADSDEDSDVPLVIADGAVGSPKNERGPGAAATKIAQSRPGGVKSPKKETGGDDVDGDRLAATNAAGAQNGKKRKASAGSLKSAAVSKSAPAAVGETATAAPASVIDSILAGMSRKKESKGKARVEQPAKAMLENPADYAAMAAVDGHKSQRRYSLWSLGEHTLLVRAKRAVVRPLAADELEGATRMYPASKAPFVAADSHKCVTATFGTKVDYFAEHGAMALSLEELANEYLLALLSDSAEHWVVRMHHMNNNVIGMQRMLQRDWNALLAKQNFATFLSHRLEFVQRLLNVVLTSDPGDYLLSQRFLGAEEYCELLPVAEQGERVVRDVSALYADAVRLLESDGQLPAMEHFFAAGVDPNVLLVWHRVKNRVPATFYPRKVEEQPSLQGSQAKIKLKWTKRGKKRRGGGHKANGTDEKAAEAPSESADQKA